MIEDAFRRAAKVSAQYTSMTLYVQATDETTGRPVGRTYTLSEDVWGTLRWLDYDAIARTFGGDVGDGIAALIAPGGPVPDLIQTAAGEWLAVAGAEGRDALGAHLRVRVRRWSGDDPVISYGAP